MKSLVFEFVQSRLDKLQTQSLRGLIAHAQSVEPEFVESLKQKYGAKASSLF
jgi:hypothetical protein